MLLGNFIESSVLRWSMLSASFFNTIFVSSHMYPENPEGTQVIVGSMNMGYISATARNRTHDLFRPKREPIPLGHSDATATFLSLSCHIYVATAWCHIPALFSPHLCSYCHITSLFQSATVTFLPGWGSTSMVTSSTPCQKQSGILFSNPRLVSAHYTPANLL